MTDETTDITNDEEFLLDKYVEQPEIKHSPVDLEFDLALKRAKEYIAGNILSETTCIRTAGDYLWVAQKARALNVDFVLVAENMQRVTIKGKTTLGLGRKGQWLIETANGCAPRIIKDAAPCYILIDENDNEWDELIDDVPPPGFGTVQRRKKVTALDTYGNYIPLNEFNEPAQFLFVFDKDRIKNLFADIPGKTADEIINLKGPSLLKLIGRCQYSIDGEKLIEIYKDSTTGLVEWKLNPLKKGYLRKDYKATFKELLGPANAPYWVDTEDRKTVLEYRTIHGEIKYQSYSLSQAQHDNYRLTSIDVKAKINKNGTEIENPTYGHYVGAGGWFNDSALMLLYKASGDGSTKYTKGTVYNQRLEDAADLENNGRLG